ncbi:uncharacterized protein M6B38_349865 [Iris pallida]|uniref:Uncharacterized protein n=1 Tax=Iris pallida TaxID=29817 RepID=A0AAX6GT72_IRIPA|nr:uncharacterized protein M6B38_349865 [Iris pallida]
MVPGSLREFGISDVVFFRDFRKGPVSCFAFPKYFRELFLVCFSFRKFSETFCDLWIWNRTSETISGHPDYAVDVIYI